MMEVQVVAVEVLKNISKLVVSKLVITYNFYMLQNAVVTHA